MHPSEFRSKFEREGLAVDYGEPLPGPITDLCTLLSDSVNAHPDSTALICLHQPWDFIPEVAQCGSVDGHKGYLSWTYAQLDVVSDRFAAGLIANGVTRGTTIASFLYNDATGAMALWASAKLACPFIPLNPNTLSNPQELQHVLEIAKVEAVLVPDEKMAASLERNASMLLPKLSLKMIAHGTPHPEWLSVQTLITASYHQDMQCTAMPVIDIEDTAVVIFTSGTTARPKGCAHSHKGLITGIYSRLKASDIHSGSRSCVHSPPYHIVNIVMMLTVWSVGGTVVHPADSFDAAAVLQAVEIENCTTFNASPSALQALLKQFSLSPTNMSSLESLILGSSLFLSKDLNTVRENFGVQKMYMFYGMSEGVPITATSQEKALETWNTDPVRVGIVCPEARLRVCAPNSVKALKRGEVGELHVGGPQVVGGYLGRNDGVFYSDEEGSWLVSGDQAMMDMNGEISILGRYKDIIISGGVNISPAAIEAVLQNEAALNAQVVGVKDDLAGEVPVAVFSEPTAGPISALKVRQAVVERLGARCAPAQLISLAQLGLQDFPKTSSGKVRKMELAAAVQRYRLEDQRLEDGRQDASVTEAVTTIWADLLGLQTKELTESTVTLDIADSITSMRFLNQVEKTFRVVITMRELLRHNSITEQVRLIGSRQGESKSPVQSWKQRSGPPTAADMAHTLGSDLKALESQREIHSKALQPLGLSWEDVEDIVPMYDYGQHLLKSGGGRREHRHVWISHEASVSGVRDALEATLANHPMLRTMTVALDSPVPVYIIIRSSPQWINRILSEHPKPLHSLSELKEYRLEDSQPEGMTSLQLLFRAIVVHVHEANAAGFILEMSHSILDATSIIPFFEDLDNALDLAGKEKKITARTPYKLWADNFFFHRSSIHAKISLDYHIDRLKLLPQQVASLFPKVQDAPNPTPGLTHKGADHSAPGFLSAATTAQVARSSTTEYKSSRLPCPRLSVFCRTHNLATAVVVKTAIAIVNTLQTRQSHAIFGNSQAGRSWPFLDDWITERLPNPIDVAGPTLQGVINLVEIRPEEDVLELLNRMQVEQNLQTKHSHVPLAELRQHFGLFQTASGESQAYRGRSGHLISEAMSRQIFNWRPFVRPPVYRNLRRVGLKQDGATDLLWTCHIVDIEDIETLQVTAKWKSDVLSEAEVGVMLEQLGLILSRITREDQPSMSVADCYIAGD